MKASWWFVGLIAISGLVGCGHQTASEPQAPAPIASPSASEPTVATSVPPSNSQLPQLPVASAKSSQSLPVPDLIPPTSSDSIVPQSEVGRPDPFSTIPVSPTVSFKPSSSTASNSTHSTPIAPAPLTTVSPVPTLPALPAGQTVPVTQLPPVSVPNLPPPRRLSEAIEISGVIEVGGKTSVIVKAPDEHSSRYVQVGDYLSNGKVLVKRVEMGMEPVVILEEDGAEVARYVGDGSSLAGLL